MQQGVPADPEAHRIAATLPPGRPAAPPRAPRRPALARWRRLRRRSARRWRLRGGGAGGSRGGVQEWAMWIRRPARVSPNDRRVRGPRS